MAAAQDKCRVDHIDDEFVTRRGSKTEELNKKIKERLSNAPMGSYQEVLYVEEFRQRLKILGIFETTKIMPTTRLKHIDSIESVDVIIPKGPGTPDHMLDEAVESVNRQSVETTCHVIYDDEERGPAWARNKGLEAADSRFISYLDADDIWTENKLERQLERISDTGAGVCIEGEPPLEKEQFLIDLFTGQISSLTSSILVDTQKVDVQWEEALERKEDHLYILEAVNCGGVCGCEDIIEVRKHSQGLSAQGDEETVTQAELTYVNLVSERIPRLEPYVDKVAAKAWLNRGRYLHFNGEYRSAIVSYYNSLKNQPQILHIPVIVISILHACSPFHPREQRGDILTKMNRLYKRVCSSSK